MTTAQKDLGMTDENLTKIKEVVARGLPWEADEKAIATKYLDESCGTLHLEWVMDHYWGLVTEKVILPSARIIYDELVKRGHGEKNTLMWGDADGHVCYIPCEGRKVFVHTTQSRDYLYIINEGETEDSWGGRFDIRRIYRQLEKDDWTYEELMKGKRSINKMLEYADSLAEHHDDHKKWATNRPSLEAYRRINFEIPYTKEHMKEKSFYGDFRDSGYILSYEFFRARTSHPTVEGSKYVFYDLEILATCNLPSIGMDLDIKLPGLSGYR